MIYTRIEKDLWNGPPFSGWANAGSLLVVRKSFAPFYQTDKQQDQLKLPVHYVNVRRLHENNISTLVSRLLQLSWSSSRGTVLIAFRLQLIYCWRNLTPLTTILHATVTMSAINSFTKFLNCVFEKIAIDPPLF